MERPGMLLIVVLVLAGILLGIQIMTNGSNSLIAIILSSAIILAIAVILYGFLNRVSCEISK
jgi:hypothetical protein